MKKYKVTVKNTEPVCVRSDRSDDYIATLEYIPGTTLLGALAGRYLMEKDKDEMFFDFFTRSNIIFPVLYPVAHAEKPANGVMPEVLPLTAKTCKRFGGFKETEPESHGIYDSLFDFSIFKETGNVEILTIKNECPECKEKMIPVSGFYSLSCSYPTHRLCEIEKILTTHTGINRQTGTVAESILYTMETIDRPYSFKGIMYIDNDLCSAFLPWAANGKIHIGAKKTAGQGTCSLEIEELPVLSFSAFKHRLTQFDREYREYRSQLLESQDKGENNSFYFSIDLVSEAIRIDPFLNYISGFKGLDEEENLPGTILVFEKTRPFELLGWNTTLGLPRQIETGIEKGSTVLYKSTAPGEELFEKLYALETNGIGIRKAEGFGQIIISNQFHSKGNAGV